MTRAKFQCTSVTKYKGWGGIELHYAAKFQAVVGEGAPENKEFFASTPNGAIEITTVGEDHFEVGRDYYVDFTKAE